MATKPQIFISYSREDTEWKDRLESHLEVYAKNGRLAVWHDGKIPRGVRWADEIENVLGRATVAVLLISKDFLRSDFIMEKEIPVIRERELDGELKIFPIVVEPCDWEEIAWIRELQIFLPESSALSLRAEKQQEADLSLAAIEIKNLCMNGRKAPDSNGSNGEMESRDESGRFKKALLVATSDHLDSIFPKSATPSNNISAFGKLLESHCSFTVKSSTDLTLRQLTGDLEIICQESTPGDIVLIYLSGHTYLGPGRNLYFCTSDTEIDNLRGTALPFKLLHEIIEEAEASNIIIFIECQHCGRNGTSIELKSLLRDQIGGGRGSP